MDTHLSCNHPAVKAQQSPEPFSRTFMDLWNHVKPCEEMSVELEYKRAKQALCVSLVVNRFLYVHN